MTSSMLGQTVRINGTVCLHCCNFMGAEPDARYFPFCSMRCQGRTRRLARAYLMIVRDDIMRNMSSPESQHYDPDPYNVAIERGAY